MVHNTWDYYDWDHYRVVTDARKQLDLPYSVVVPTTDRNNVEIGKCLCDPNTHKIKQVIQTKKTLTPLCF